MLNYSKYRTKEQKITKTAKQTLKNMHYNRYSL